MDVKNTLEAQLGKLIDDKCSVDKANAITAMSAQIIYSKRLEIEGKMNEERVRYWNKGKNK